MCDNSTVTFFYFMPNLVYKVFHHIIKYTPYRFILVLPSSMFMGFHRSNLADNLAYLDRQSSQRLHTIIHPMV